MAAVSPNCGEHTLTAPALVLFGASGYSTAIADVFESWSPDPIASVVAYIEDGRGDSGFTIGGVPVISFETWRATLRDTPLFVCPGNPDARRMLVERVTAAGGRFASFYRIVPPIANDVVVGEGSMILAYASIGPRTLIGRHVHVMPLVTIGADCRIGDFTTLCPSSTIWGEVVVEERVFVGVGARIVADAGERLTIGAGAIIGAGAVVTRSVAPGQRMMGNPAKDLRTLAAERSK